MALELRVQVKNFALAGGGRREIFRNVALDLPEGGRIALLGPSGCGKSTLLRMIAGLDRDFSGVLRGAPAPVGMVFQEPRLLPWRNVAQNIALAAPGLSRDQILEVLDAFELAGHVNDFPGQLSGGLARRVALARAFAVAPKLVVLDEPFASLDGALHQRLREKIAAKILGSGSALALATHDLDDALLLADEIFVLHPAPEGIARRFVTPAPPGLERAGRLEALRAAFEAG